jgi:hypothetical protein
MYDVSGHWEEEQRSSRDHAWQPNQHPLSPTPPSGEGGMLIPQGSFDVPGLGIESDLPRARFPAKDHESRYRGDHATNEGAFRERSSTLSRDLDQEGRKQRQ